MLKSKCQTNSSYPPTNLAHRFTYCQLMKPTFKQKLKTWSRNYCSATRTCLRLSPYIISLAHHQNGFLASLELDSTNVLSKFSPKTTHSMPNYSQIITTLTWNMLILVAKISKPKFDGTLTNSKANHALWLFLCH